MYSTTCDHFSLLVIIKIRLVPDKPDQGILPTKGFYRSRDPTDQGILPIKWLWGDCVMPEFITYYLYSCDCSVQQSTNWIPVVPHIIPSDTCSLELLARQIHDLLSIHSNARSLILTLHSMSCAFVDSLRGMQTALLMIPILNQNQYPSHRIWAVRISLV